MSRNSRYFIFSILVLLFAYAMSLGLRIDMFMERTGAQGLEASYHVLWTVQALEASPPEAHRFLPTVTRAPDPDALIGWGQTVPTPGGSQVYTSFPPLGFLVPFAVLGPLPGGHGFLMLALLNSLVGLAAAAGLGGLARAAALSLRADAPDAMDGAVRDRDGWVVFAAVAVCYLLSREALVSHGAVYWPHSLAQLCLIAGCWLAFRVFRRVHGWADLAGLFAVALIYPALEWTGFVFNAGLVLAFMGDGVWRRRAGVADGHGHVCWSAAVLVVLATLVSGGTIVAHYVSVIGAAELLSALGERAGARSFRAEAVVGLPLGYFISFGALVPLAALAAVRAVSAGLAGRHRPVALLIFVAAFPLLENAVMMQHAHQFSFDRLKLGVPLLLIGALVAAHEGIPRRPVLLLGLVYLVIASNLQTFGHATLHYRPWGDAVAENDRILRAFAADPLADCAVMGTDGSVRGYLNLAFGRDIAERTDRAAMVAAPPRPDPCGIAFVETRDVFRDLPAISAITVLDADGTPLRRYE